MDAVRPFAAGIIGEAQLGRMHKIGQAMGADKATGFPPLTAAAAWDLAGAETARWGLEIAVL